MEEEHETVPWMIAEIMATSMILKYIISILSEDPGTGERIRHRLNLARATMESYFKRGEPMSMHGERFLNAHVAALRKYMAATKQE